MRTRPLRMRQITWPVSRGSKQLHFWNLRCRFVYLPCSFGGSTMKAIKLSAKIMYGFVLKVVWVSAHARNHQLVAFTAILATFYVHALKRLFIKFRSEFRHHLSILQPIFPYEVQNFGDLATVAIVFFAFYMLKVRHISTTGLFDPMTCKVCYRRRLPLRKFPPSLKLTWPSTAEL